MRILFVNTYHYPGGGDRTYMFKLADLFTSKGHKVAYFAMHNERNVKSEWANYFVDQINFKKEYESKSVGGVVRVFSRSIYSIESKKKIKKLIRDFNPNVALIQTIHNHISPSVIHTLKEYGIPVIWNLHIYTPLCINSTFLCNGQICEDCKPTKFYMAVKNKCKKGSILASMVGAIAAYAHKITKIYDLVDFYISPSKFLKTKFIEFGFPPEKIIHIPNFIAADKIVAHYGGEYGLFFGRLSPEKGAITLLKSLINNKDIPFKIVGDGEQAKILKEYAFMNGLKEIEFTGFKFGEELSALISNAKFVVVPSEWYENLPYSIIEAFAFGKPVIATNIGGIPEIVDNNRNGFLFRYKDYNKLSHNINALYNNTELCIDMGKEARRDVKAIYNKDIYYRKIVSLISALS